MSSWEKSVEWAWGAVEVVEEEGGVEAPSRGTEEETWTWEVPRWASWRRRAVLAAEGRSNVMMAFCFSNNKSEIVYS